MLRFVALVGIAACYSPSYTTCAVTCATSNACPSGLDCVGGVCVSPGQSCGVSGDGSTDTHMQMDAASRTPWVSIAPEQIVPPVPSMDDPTLREDRLEMFVNVGGSDIYRTLRPTTNEPWGPIQLITELDNNANNGGPDLSSDGLEVVWTTNATGDFDLMYSTRPDTTGASASFAQPGTVPGVKTPSLEGSPALSKDRLVLVFQSDRIVGDPAGLFIATRPNTNPTQAWSMPTRIVKPDDPAAADESPYLSDDMLTLYFASNRGGNFDLYYATRASVADPFGPALPIDELNTAEDENDPWVSADGVHIYFSRHSSSSNATSIWSATR